MNLYLDIGKSAPLLALLVLTACTQSQGASPAPAPQEEVGPCEVDNGGCDPQASCSAAGEEAACACPDGLSGEGISCEVVACPEGAAPFEGLCACEEDRHGALAWDPQSQRYDGECVTGLEMALRTGDASFISTRDEVLTAAAAEMEVLGSIGAPTLQAIYGAGRVAYDPTEMSQFILTDDLRHNFALLPGNSTGQPLALAGARGASRYAAFGSHPIWSFGEGLNAAYRPSLDRVLSWLLTADADAGSGAYEVAVSWMGDDLFTMTELEDAHPDWNLHDCSATQQMMDCWGGKDLLILGSLPGAEVDAEEVSAALAAAMDEGTSVLYLHTAWWERPALGGTILEQMRMSFGPYGGNFWSEDAADWASVDALLEAGGLTGSLARPLVHIQRGDFSFDWGQCTDFVGQTLCGDVPGLSAEFLTGAQQIQRVFSGLDSRGDDLFGLEGERHWKLLALLGDVLRREIDYPMDKRRDVAAFMSAYFADHTVLYSRLHNSAQKTLGSFGDVLDADSVDLETHTVTVEVSKDGGYTALGLSVLPGETFTVEAQGEAADLAVKINTQRTGSTREFNEEQYDRPKFLQSPALSLSAAQARTLTSPYGGTLQLVAEPSEAARQVTVTVTGAARHPVLEDLTDLDAYLEALAQTPFSQTEIKTPYVQIHSRVDMMLEAFEAELYRGDPELFFDHLTRFMILDTYALAGFVGQGLGLNEGVQTFCQAQQWDCTDPVIHSSPIVQHINIDTYAHCGGGCAGNPYDQAWALIPLGWGETHEIGHNLQRGRLMVHGNRSGEVSNQIFPIHKHVTYNEESDESLSADRSAYRTTFDILQASVSQQDPWQHVYDAVWSGEGIYDENNERITFYMQVVHLNDDVSPLETGWDVYTLMYLHERLFTAAIADGESWGEARERLGFTEYQTPPREISGNDFMLVSMSFVTQRDQRPFFDMWGVDFTERASQQVEAYGLAPISRHFFASEDSNEAPHPEPVPIDGESPWPL